MAQAASLARAWIGTIVFLFLAPGVVAGLIPWFITGWRWHDWGAVAPTQTLVVNGVYRFVRNPMYLAVLAIIIGQALLFGSWVLVFYAAVALGAVVAFVKGYEEPTLTEAYGEQYLDYRRNVPGWCRG